MKTFNRFVAALIAVVLVSLSALAPSGALAGDSATAPGGALEKIRLEKPAPGASCLDRERWEAKMFMAASSSPKYTPEQQRDLRRHAEFKRDALLEMTENDCLEILKMRQYASTKRS